MDGNVLYLLVTCSPRSNRRRLTLQYFYMIHRVGWRFGNKPSTGKQILFPYGNQEIHGSPIPQVVVATLTLNGRGTLGSLTFVMSLGKGISGCCHSQDYATTYVIVFATAFATAFAIQPLP